jgi:hypothetical protein
MRDIKWVRKDKLSRNVECKCYIRVLKNIYVSIFYKYLCANDHSIATPAYRQREKRKLRFKLF